MAALRRLLTDTDLSVAMSASARRYAVDEADSATCIRRLEQLYEGVIAQTVAS